MKDTTLQRLATYRLANDLTFEALAEQMESAGFFVPARALHLALTARLKTKPRERTLYKIAQFLKTLDEPTAGRPARRRQPAAKASGRNGRSAIHG